MMKDIGCSNSYMIVGVSGGPDSMALLDLLRRIGMKAVIAHVNYQKRPTADRDEKIVKDYAKRYGIPYFVTRPTYHKDNFQAWAREVRYSFYKEIADIFSTRSIFLAHNLDDYIETLMMQMKRGSFHKHYGIAKFSLHDDYQIFRPLIIYPKSLLETYCQKNAIEYGVDETNLEDDYTRNYLRHHELKGLTLKAKLEIYKVSEDIGKRRDAYLQMIEDRYQRDIYSFEEYEQIIDKDAFLRLKTRYELSKEHLKEIKRQLEDAEEVMIRIDKSIISKERNSIYCLKNVEPYVYIYNKIVLDKKRFYTLVSKADNFHACTVYDSDLPIKVRSFKDGDKIVMRYGTKKISRFFIDHKIPKIYRLIWPVVENREGEIIFTPGIGANKTHYSTNNNLFMLEYGNMEDR